MFENEEDEDWLLEVTVLASDDKASPGIASKSCIQLNGTMCKACAVSQNMLVYSFQLSRSIIRLLHTYRKFLIIWLIISSLLFL